MTPALLPSALAIGAALPSLAVMVTEAASRVATRSTLVMPPPCMAWPKAT
jgi:hypothetical protein